MGGAGSFTLLYFGQEPASKQSRKESAGEGTPGREARMGRGAGAPAPPTAPARAVARAGPPARRRRRARASSAVMRNKAVLLLLLMQVLLVFALAVSLGAALRSPPQSEWAALVADIERQHALVPFVQAYGQNDTWFSASNPPLSPDAAEEVKKHVPRMWQRSGTQVNIRVSHEMIWTPNDVVDFAHYIHYVFVRNSSSSEIVYVGILELGDTSVDIDTTVLGGLGGQGFLVPYEFCNVHGLWRGEALQTVDPVSWNLTTASLKLFGQVEEECQGNIYLLDDSHSLQLSLINRYDEVVVDVADAVSLQATFVFPRGQFFGLGFGDSMLGADMMIAAERDGTALCADFHTTGNSNRYSGPDIDAQQDVQVVAATLQDGVATLVCTKSLRSADPDDKAVLNQRENLIWSFQEVDGEPSATSNAFLKRHGATNRGYILNADLGGSGGELAIANSRDKRDLQVAHGMLMYMIWGINICVGAMIARYAHDRAWGIGAHRIIQSINTMLTLPGYYLSQRFVDVHFQSAHAFIGTTLVYTSILQAGLGTAAYLCSKYSKKVAREYPKSDALSDENKLFIAGIEDEHGQRELLHEVYHKLDTLSTPRAFEITAYVENTISQGIPSCMPPAIAVYILTRMRQTVIRPIHRVVGRLLPIIAYVQIYLGLDRLQANNVISAIINMWTILVVLILIYKESELQLNLPHGVAPKLFLLKDRLQRLFCSCCPRTQDPKPDANDGDDDDNGDIDGAATGGGEAGNRSSRNLLEKGSIRDHDLERSHSSIHNDHPQGGAHGSPFSQAKTPMQSFQSAESVDSQYALPPAPCSSPKTSKESPLASSSLEFVPLDDFTKTAVAEEGEDDEEEQAAGKLQSSSSIEGAPPRIIVDTKPSFAFDTSPNSGEQSSDTEGLASRPTDNTQETDQEPGPDSTTSLELRSISTV